MIMGLVNYSEIFSEGKTLSEEIEFFARYKQQTNTQTMNLNN